MTNKEFIERKKRVKKILIILHTLFSTVKIALNYSNNWELLVAVVLSAQSTDKKVNEVTRKLFKKYRKFDDYVRASQREFSNAIKEIGLYRTKTKNILAAAAILKKKYHGKLPKTMDEMIALPGIGRKSANVILHQAFGLIEGIAVDTHVRRFAIRFDLTDSTDPKKIEQDLMQLFPKKEWPGITCRLIEYGRQICPARKHDCTEHPLTKGYPQAAQRWYSPGKKVTL